MPLNVSLNWGSVIVPGWSVLAELRCAQAQLVALTLLFTFPQRGGLEVHFLQRDMGMPRIFRRLVALTSLVT